MIQRFLEKCYFVVVYIYSFLLIRHIIIIIYEEYFIED